MRWRLLGLACFMFAEVSSAPLWSQGTQLSEVGGHTLEYWISQIPSKDQSKSEHAIKMVVSFGPDRAYLGVPAILDRLRKHTPQTPVDASVRVNGAIALGFILGNYKEADPKLVKDAVTILKRSLADSQSIVRYRAAQALGAMGPEAKDAIPEVINVVKDTATWETRQAAAIALGQIAIDKVNGPSVNVLKALYGALGDAALQVRLGAIQSLTFLGGPVNPEVRLNLVRALEPVANKDAEASVRIWAHLSIMNITATVDKDRVELISQMVTNPEVNTRIQAVQALGTLGTQAKETIPRLTKCLNDRESLVVSWAAWALGRMGPAAISALPLLERLKVDPARDEAVRKMADDAINQINAKKIN